MCLCTIGSWDTVLMEAIKHAGAREIVTHALLVCLTGMHPQVHPAHRPDWTTRLRILRSASHAINTRREDVVSSALYVKEAIRRCLASTMHNTPAMHAALSSLGHPVRHLHQPPRNLPHIGMEAAMTAFIEAGEFLVEREDGGGLAACLKRAFRQRGTEEFASGAHLSLGGLAWDGSWLGKGTADVHVRQPLVALAGDVWASAFKAHFIAFWLFAQSHQLRVSRLDEVQHSAIHSMNAATRLAAQLSEDMALATQRIALRNPSAGILTLTEVAEELGLTGIATTSPNCGARSPLDGARLLGDAGSVAAGRLLAYARVAWISEEVLVYDLGEHTKRMQLTALRKRLRCSSPTPLPVHATHLCACTECHRVANAYATSASDVAFNELGVSSCQIATDCEPGTLRLHCAKRSSAALRTAITFESMMKRRRVEDSALSRAELTRLTAPRKASGVDSGIAARVRRDAKNALEQRSTAIACGEHPMVTIPIVGRAVRVYKNWFALCSYCAALVRVQPHLHRYGAEICCLRCDANMIEPDLELLRRAPTNALRKLCRFCGAGMFQHPAHLCPFIATLSNSARFSLLGSTSPHAADECVCSPCAVDPERSGTRWKEVKAPLDVAGPNDPIPPPLRRVRAPGLRFSISPLHAKSVLAHHTLSTDQCDSCVYAGVVLPQPLPHVASECASRNGDARDSGAHCTQRQAGLWSERGGQGRIAGTRAGAQAPAALGFKKEGMRHITMGESRLVWQCQRQRLCARYCPVSR